MILAISAGQQGKKADNDRARRLVGLMGAKSHWPTGRPIWHEGKTPYTVCGICGRLLRGEPPLACDECLTAVKARKHLARRERKRAKAGIE